MRPLIEEAVAIGNVYTLPAGVDRISLGSNEAPLIERFANAGDFTFVLVGNFVLDSIRPLVERYLAALPGNPASETARDIDVSISSPFVE